MNDTHQELTYADDLNLIGDDIRTIGNKLNACRDTGLAVNIGKTKYGNRTSSRHDCKMSISG